MSLRPLHLLGSPVLRQRSAEVGRPDDEVAQLVEDLFETMDAARGVGLAANQIGVARRVAVVDADEDRFEMIDPIIVESEGRAGAEEGCLSIPGYVAEVGRAAKVTVKARDRHGKEFRVKGEELFARALQHEIDHLNGVLYIDHLESLEELVRVSDRPSEVEEEAAAGI